MPLQYDSEDTGKLLYIDYPSPLAGKLQADCWCGDTNIWFYACCMPNSGDPLYPQYIIIGRTRWNALGNPSCVFYNSCLYCLEFPVSPEDQYTGCPTNVIETDVTTSVYTKCSDSWPTALCSTCLVCAPCTDAQTPSFVNLMVISPNYNVTVKMPFKSIDPIFLTCEYNDYTGVGDTDYGGASYYYAGGVVDQVFVGYTSGACSFGGFVFNIPHCAFTGEYTHTVTPPEDIPCWANDYGDVLRMILWPPA